MVSTKHQRESATGTSLILRELLTRRLSLHPDCPKASLGFFHLWLGCSNGVLTSVASSLLTAILKIPDQVQIPNRLDLATRSFAVWPCIAWVPILLPPLPPGPAPLLSVCAFSSSSTASRIILKDLPSAPRRNASAPCPCLPTPAPHAHFLWHLTPCLSPFRLLSQNTTPKVTYRQQKCLSHRSGSLQSRVPAELVSGEGLFPDRWLSLLFNLPHRGGQGSPVGSLLRALTPLTEDSTFSDLSPSQRPHLSTIALDFRISAYE